jgi:CheY-like chemotaxis protein/HPt (histidine-containing phosphotransfer) domain-containing protein
MRLLVIDDDPLSRTWFAAVLGDAGAHVTVVSSFDAGRAALASATWSAVLCDLRLPDGDGRDLARLRDRAGAPRLHAMSADLDAATRAQLAALGFEHAWQKPIDAGALLQALGLAQERACIGGVREPAPGESTAATEPPDLDDAAGLIACGDPGVLADLRALLLAELPMARARIDAAWSSGDRSGAADGLHRLLAGARYCGAARLLTCIDRFEQRAREAAEAAADAAVLAEFSRACDRLLAHPA